MTNQTDLISEVRASLQAATPGPWSYDTPIKWTDGMEEHGLDEEETADWYEIVKSGTLAIVPDIKRNSDAHLIASAPTWLQQLTDRLDEAVKALEWYGDEERTFEDMSDDGGVLARTTLKRIKGDL